MKDSTFAREVAFLDLTARHLWRFIRPFVSRHLTRRCKCCVLPESCSPINQQGICAECESFQKSVKPTEGDSASSELQARLHTLFDSHQGKADGPFDALLLLSGGKDSAYMLHRISTAYPGLRLLSVLVDNGFMSPVALENAYAILRKFDIPHITIKIKPSIVKKTFRHTLLNLDKQKGYSIVDLMDGCMTFDHAKLLAARMEIPLIICGLGKIQLENVFGPVSLELPQEQGQSNLATHAGVVLNELFDKEELQHWFDGSQWPTEKTPRFIVPFTVWDPKEEDVLQEVERLGLISRKKSSPILTNNALIPIIGMAEVSRFGYSCFEVEFSRMVREGKSERTYWLNLFEMLEYSTKTGRFLSDSAKQTLHQLELTPKEIGIGK